MRTLKFFSTFTGIGGLDMGLEKLGAKCVGFSEVKESSVAVYKSHYPDRKNFGDITKIVPAELPDFDVFTGGFPCQAFSIAGDRKGFKDRRGQMIFYIYDILMAKKPEFVVLENVKGLMNHNGGKTYQNVFKILTSAGYKVRCILLNASHYGSPQARERVLLLCRRGKDFEAKNPEMRDGKKRFRDIREKKAEFRYVSPERLEKFLDGSQKASMVGGYDRVNTLTTGPSTSGRAAVITQEQGDERFRYLTEVEGERLQGFPDNWTAGVSRMDRWFAIGNAVNCKMSEYLFTDYLKGVWW